jgi:hypothetical protein
MPRVKVGPALPNGSTLDVEVARLRDLDIASLQARSRNMFRRRPSPHARPQLSGWSVHRALAGTLGLKPIGQNTKQGMARQVPLGRWRRGCRLRSELFSVRLSS